MAHVECTGALLPCKIYSLGAHYLADGVRFELTVGRPTLVFKTSALDHSATHPYRLLYTIYSTIVYMKYIGIDYGTKRVGVALSDDTGSLAFPLGVISAGPHATPRRAVEYISAQIVELASKECVSTVVVGESRDYSGQENAVMKQVKLFANALEASGLVVVYEQEFMTSVAAARQYAPDGSRKENLSHDKLDSAAAAIILQSYLDRQKYRDSVE